MESINKEINLKIDDKDVKAIEGTSILNVAENLGIEIPTLCFHKALSPFGACRVCSVEIVDKRGRKRIVTSCNYPVEEGLIVYTKSRRVVQTRKTLLELLLARCPNATRIKGLAQQYEIKEPKFCIEDAEEDCILCGLCARVCEEQIGVYAINFANRGVERMVTTPYMRVSDDCIGCGACATVCPTHSKKTRLTTYPLLEEDARKIEQQFLKGTLDENLGVYSNIFSAKSKIDGQDGGVATALLVSGMQKGFFDAAIVVQRKGGYWAEAVVAETVDQLMTAKGTKYLRVKMMSKLADLVEKGKRKIAIVGTACEVRVARKIQQLLLNSYPDLELTIIGLFCFEAFDYEKLKKTTKELLGIDLDIAEKTQIHKGKYIVQVNGQEHSISVKDVSAAIEKGCPYCYDFTAKYADISVGSVGSDEGYSTVIVRSINGERLADSLDSVQGDVREEEITKLAILKKKRAGKKFGAILEDKRVQPASQVQ